MSFFIEPIYEDNPIGEDCKYDDKYLELEIEIEKFFNATSEGETDWEFIISRSEDILKEKSKDLKVASYWLFAKLKTGGWVIFMDSLEQYIELLEKYGKDIYPKPARRKVKIAEWIERVFEEPLQSNLENFSQDQLKRVSELLKRLKEAFSESTEDGIEILKDVVKRADTLLETALQRELEAQKEAELYAKQEAKRREEEQKLAKENEKKRKEVEEVLKKFQPVHSLSGGFPKEKESFELKELSKEGVDALKHAYLSTAKEGLSESQCDYRSYMPLLLLCDMMIGEAIKDPTIEKESYLPTEDIAAAARKLCDLSEITIGQLDAVVEQLLQKPAWVEGYYIVSRLLYKLDRADDAGKVEEELLYMIHRKRELLEWRLKHGTYVPEKMVSWINTKLLSLCGESGGNVEYKMAYQEVLGILKEQGAQNAFSLLEEYFRKAVSEEERFRWRLLFVEFALEIGDKRLAMSLLLELEKAIEYFKIDRWQPELAIITYESLLRPIISQQLSNEVKERIYNKLSILDVQKVISL